MDTLQLVADPRRRAILEMVWDDELAAGDIAAGVQLGFEVGHVDSLVVHWLMRHAF